MSWMGIPTSEKQERDRIMRADAGSHVYDGRRAEAVRRPATEPATDERPRPGRGEAPPIAAPKPVMPEPEQMHVEVPRSDEARLTVAVFGASHSRSKFGNKAVRAYGDAGYEVWPVNPKGGRIEGFHAFGTVSALPDVPHVASVYLHEKQALEVLDQLAEMEARTGKKIAELYLNPGADTPIVRKRAEEHGFVTHSACSIRAIGRKPNDFPDE